MDFRDDCTSGSKGSTNEPRYGRIIVDNEDSPSRKIDRFWRRSGATGGSGAWRQGDSAFRTRGELDSSLADFDQLLPDLRQSRPECGTDGRTVAQGDALEVR